ncbi:MAG: 50S ribosomal protein L15 [Aigarchaeota archaeon]|nr:50S ribosomal protein L15 [Candidatus Wolframiiraptor gerlachensis]
MGTRHRKSRKRRGSRTCGWGQIGQHRKSGSRGGHGHAGMHKHKWTWVLRYDPDYFGKHGFYRPNKREIRSMNLIQLSTLVENLERRGELKLMDGMPVIDLSALGVGKLVGRGKLDRGFVVIVDSWTERAEKAVREAGGKLLKPSEIEGVAA